VIAYAAIDLRGGRVVQLVGGKPEEERVSLADPLAVARHWVDIGFRALHVVDLDAALGLGSNARHIEEIAAGVDVPIQVGGGVRDNLRVAELLRGGAARVILGTRAVEDRQWLEAMAEQWPGRIVVAADTLDGKVVTRGWTFSSGIPTVRFVAGLAQVPIGGILVTDVKREGRMEGIDEAGFRRIVEASAHPILASGGVGGDDDLRKLEAAGAAGVVIGMALYTGAIDPHATAGAYTA
jgi:phosphoribosylformimino-5-aminoimidazole carboxamide ribotide isomerase